MPFFSSDRERRLWACTLIVVLAIYSTLPLARSLSMWLGETGLGASLFVFCCLLVLATVMTQGMRTMPSGREIAVGLGVVAAYLLVFVRMSVPTERSHLIEYGVVAVFTLEALTERLNNGRTVRRPAILAVLITSVLGVIDECIQGLLPSRVFEITDMLFNILAAVMAVTTSVALDRARRRAVRARSAGNHYGQDSSKKQ